VRTNGPGRWHVFEALRYFLERAAIPTGAAEERYFAFGQARGPTRSDSERETPREGVVRESEKGRVNRRERATRRERDWGGERLSVCV
jgi:hypothetical protein